jgi:misacylated tRNA(Ala) deacylase
MTQLLYLDDPYLKEIDAQIVKADGNKVVLDKTIFYPGGGGQPADTGTILIEGKAMKVLGMEKTDGEVFHVLEAPLEEGTKVHCAIDWEKRYKYMRYHTAIHIIDGVMVKEYGAGLSTGGQIFEDRARVDFDMPQLNRQLAEEIIVKANRVVEQGLSVKIRYLTKDEALKVENLARTEPGRKLIESLDKVRIIDIEGLDFQADGGCHVANTKEVGKITLLGFENKGSHHKRIEIKLEGT